jgi:hypothetical protein
VAKVAAPAPVEDTITPTEMPGPRDILAQSPAAPSIEEGSTLRRLLQGRDPAELATSATTRGATATRPTAPTGKTSLSDEDIRILQSTLFDLLECKRLLDQSRQKNP